MPSRPDPPDDCEEASNYAAGVAVYYFRTGKFFARPHGSDMCPCLMAAHLIQPGKWRNGTIVGKGGTSDDSPRYLVSLTLKAFTSSHV